MNSTKSKIVYSIIIVFCGLHSLIAQSNYDSDFSNVKLQEQILYFGCLNTIQLPKNTRNNFHVSYPNNGRSCIFFQVKEGIIEIQSLCSAEYLVITERDSEDNLVEHRKYDISVPPKPEIRVIAYDDIFVSGYNVESILVDSTKNRTYCKVYSLDSDYILPNSIKLELIPDAEFLKACPLDANYELKGFTVDFASGKKVIKNLSTKGNHMDFSEFKYFAGQADRIVIIAKNAMRYNWRNDRMNVRLREPVLIYQLENR